MTALRTPHVRGRWGEVQLRRVVEVAGLLEHCDFVEQPSGSRTTQGAGVRPDLVVTLADGRQVVVDAKVPFTGYIEAVQATDQAVRDQRVQLHARQLRTHVDALAARRYPTAFRPAAPFTVLFVPSDGFLTTALEAEPGLLEYGFARDVVLATPSTLLALLRTVAYSWRQERLARDADQVLEVGRLLHARLSTLSGHLTRLGVRAGHDDGALQRDRRLLRALGADRGPPVRRPGRRGEPGPRAARAGGGDGAHPRGPRSSRGSSAAPRRRRDAATAPAAEPSPARRRLTTAGARSAVVSFAQVVASHAAGGVVRRQGASTSAPPAPRITSCCRTATGRPRLGALLRSCRPFDRVTVTLRRKADPADRGGTGRRCAMATASTADAWRQSGVRSERSSDRPRTDRGPGAERASRPLRPTPPPPLRSAGSSRDRLRAPEDDHGLRRRRRDRPHTGVTPPRRTARGHDRQPPSAAAAERSSARRRARPHERTPAERAPAERREVASRGRTRRGRGRTAPAADTGGSAPAGQPRRRRRSSMLDPGRRRRRLVLHGDAASGWITLGRPRRLHRARPPCGVRRRDLLSVVVAPPLVVRRRGRPEHRARRRRPSFNLATMATLLVRGFPTMAMATGAALVVAPFRSRPPAAEPTGPRRTGVRAGRVEPSKRARRLLRCYRHRQPA